MLMFYNPNGKKLIMLVNKINIYKVLPQNMRQINQSNS